MKEKRITEIMNKHGYIKSKIFIKMLTEITKEIHKEEKEKYYKAIYTTKTYTSYRNCHPEIAASLQKGEHIKCSVFDGNNGSGGIVDITSFIINEGYSWYQDVNGNNWNKATPYPKTETRVIGPIAMMEQLIDHGYEYDECGYWKNAEGIKIRPWEDCGRKVNSKIIQYYSSWMLNEVDI